VRARRSEAFTPADSVHDHHPATYGQTWPLVVGWSRMSRKAEVKNRRAANGARPHWKKGDHPRGHPPRAGPVRDRRAPTCQAPARVGQEPVALTGLSPQPRGVYQPPLTAGQWGPIPPPAGRPTRQQGGAGASPSGQRGDCAAFTQQRTAERYAPARREPRHRPRPRSGPGSAGGSRRPAAERSGAAVSTRDAC
jgi:hypothetical protein